MIVCYREDYDSKLTTAILIKYRDVIENAFLNYSDTNLSVKMLAYLYKPAILPEHIDLRNETIFFINIGKTWSIEKLREVAKYSHTVIWLDRFPSAKPLMDKISSEFDNIKCYYQNDMSTSKNLWNTILKWRYNKIIDIVDEITMSPTTMSRDALELKVYIDSVYSEPQDLIWTQIIKQVITKDVVTIKTSPIIDYLKHYTGRFLEFGSTFSTIDGSKVMVMNCYPKMFIPSILRKNSTPVVTCFFDMTRFNYTIFSNDESFDCSKIAENHDGSGDKHCAQFSTKYLIFKKKHMMEEIYEKLL